jgi:SAM-dependent methyltransferase
MNYYNYICLIFLFWFFSFFSIAPFLPTKTKDLSRINKLSNLKSWEKFLEVWCGTAKVCSYIAKNNPNSVVIWIELSPFLYFYSKIKSLLLNYKNLKIVYWNAFNLDFSWYDVIYIFWMDKALKNKILPKYQKEWKGNSRLISYCFSVEFEWLNQIKHKENQTTLAIYEYKKINN